MQSTDNVGVTFVNVIVGRGAFNGNINLSLGTYLFSPNDQGGVDPDLVVSSRLRMDIPCAKELYRYLGEILEAIERSAKANGAAANEDMPSIKEETLN